MSQCPSCDRETYPEDAFCSQCGTRLQARSADTGLVRRTILRQTTATIDRLACGSCNGPLLAGEVFCATCGARYGPGTSQPGQREIRERILKKLEAATRGRFEFVREIGRGGMGAVWLARELELERNVAIKVLSSSWLLDGSMVERFRREAKTIASLRHPSIVHVHGVGRADDIHYFIMDFIDGVSLGRILLTHGPLSIPAVLAVLGQVGSALNYAHRPGRSVIHRDIKPGNIMVDSEGGSYLTDFGISKATETHSGLTMTGLIMGTPEYMSPEQCRGDAAGPPSDQYALGAVAFAMLTGSPPFTGPHYRVLVGHTAEQPPRVRDLRPDCPEHIDDAVARMLAKLPGERWPDVADAMAALGARPTLPDDPVRDELAELVLAARGARRGAEQTPEVAEPVASEATPTWLRILSIPEALEAGDAIDLRAVKGFADGREIENGDVRWESTDPAIARIDPETGRLVAVATGSAKITASVAGVSESVALDVRPARVTQLVLDPASMQLEVGDSHAFVASPLGKAGQTLDRPVLWSSSDPGIATIGDTGTVSGHREGTANVLAHCDGVGASAPVTVVPSTVVATAIELSSPPSELIESDTFHIMASPRDAAGEPLDLPVAWSVTDEHVIEPLGDGRFRAVGEGRTSVVARAGNAESLIELRVDPVRIVSLAIVSPPSTLQVDEVAELATVMHDQRGRPAQRPVVWSTTDPWIARVNVRGVLEGAGAGSATITAECDGVTDSFEIEVTAAPWSTVVFQPEPEDEADSGAGDTPAGDAPDASVAEHAHSTAPEAAPGAVADRRRMIWIAPVALVGVAAITWFALNGGDDAQQVEPLPIEPAAASVSIVDAAGNALDDLQLVEGDTVRLGARVAAADGTALSGMSVQWSTSDASLASVDASGMLIALAAGRVGLSAAAGAAEGDIVVNVAAAEPPVAVAPDPPPARPPTRTQTETPGAGGVESSPEPVAGNTAAQPPPENLPPGTLQLIVVPQADITINGEVRARGQRRFEIELPPGTYRLLLENPSRMPRDTTIEIRSGETLPLQFTLTPRGS